MDKDALFKARLPEAEVEVEGLGTFRVRGLSRLDVLSLRQVDDASPGAFERKLLSLALIDPALTEDEVGEWQKVGNPYELETLVDKVMDMSALNADAAKERYKEFESDQDGEFRVLPS